MTRKPALKVSPEPPRGMRDILPDEAELRDATAQTILAVYRRYGFRRVETPALENIQLLTQGEGGENEKLIFKILKRGEKLDLARAAGESDLVDLGLRFDLTVPLARYYAHNHAQLAKPLKAVQIGPVWRAERPQKGRFRQFTQCDIDILAVRSAVAEIELILATTEALRELGLRDLTVRINDRRILVGMARACGFASDRYSSVFITLDKMDKVERPVVIKELQDAGHPASAIAALMQLFAHVERTPGSDRSLDELRARLGQHADEEAFAGLATIMRTTNAEAGGHWQITFDPTLVRGMSYYTGPIFEIGSSAFPSSIAGGGRYDDMIGKILGEPVPATGFSIGFERVVSILMASVGGRAGRDRRLALMFDEGVDALPAVLSVARRLRAEGLAVSVEGRGKRLGAQLAALEAHGFAGFAIFDGTERPELRWFGDRERSGASGSRHD